MEYDVGNRRLVLLWIGQESEEEEISWFRESEKCIKWMDKIYHDQPTQTHRVSFCALQILDETVYNSVLGINHRLKEMEDKCNVKPCPEDKLRLEEIDEFRIVQILKWIWKKNDMNNSVGC